MMNDLTYCIPTAGAMSRTERTFASAREHQHPSATRHLSDVRNPNAATIAQEEGNMWQWTRRTGK
jgi:hypothetical protein